MLPILRLFTIDEITIFCTLQKTRGAKKYEFKKNLFADYQILDQASQYKKVVTKIWHKVGSLLMIVPRVRSCGA
jgi:hypothetical protein